MTASHKQHLILGAALVAGSAITWSFGGAIARYIEATGWVIIFWRSYFAAAFLLAVMVFRDGGDGTIRLFRNMGWAGLGVATCFAIASSSFVIALGYTTVANILLIQAATPLFAALLAFFLFGEKPAVTTWAAIAAVIAGLAFMVKDSLTGAVSPIGDGLALLIAISFSIATVITRRASHVRMMPAVCLGTMFACVFSAVMVARTGTFDASFSDLGFMFLFGAINLGAGLAMFSVGARLVPAAIAALIGTLEPVLAPLWVWLAHNEVPSRATIIGGSVVFAALFAHLMFEWAASRRA